MLRQECCKFKASQSYRVSSRQILGNLVRTCFKTKHLSLSGFTYSKKEGKEEEGQEEQEEEDGGECPIMVGGRGWSQDSVGLAHCNPEQ